MLQIGMSYPFYIVDVFTRQSFAGNPVAIVLAPDEHETTMLRLAGWTGMPETVFVTPPKSKTADYGLRIFSSARELAFAGHPSIGACHLLLELGHVAPRGGFVTQECSAGLFEMHIEGNDDTKRIGFTARIEAVELLPSARAARVARALGLIPRAVFIVQAGARWIVARYETAADLAALTPSFPAVRELADSEGALGVSVYAPSPDNDADIEVRSFAPSIGVDEDAVCGGGNACVAATIAHDPNNNIFALTASQGRHLGRRGRVHLDIAASDGLVRIAGQAVTSLRGVIALP